MYACRARHACVRFTAHRLTQRAEFDGESVCAVEIRPLDPRLQQHVRPEDEALARIHDDRTRTHFLLASAPAAAGREERAYVFAPGVSAPPPAARRAREPRYVDSVVPLARPIEGSACAKLMDDGNRNEKKRQNFFFFHSSSFHSSRLSHFSPRSP